MSNPVPKQKKSNENITRHVQEGTGVCFPNPPQTPPIHRSSFVLDSLRNQFCSITFPPDVRSNAMPPENLEVHGVLTRPDRISRFLLYVKIRYCKLFSPLPKISTGKGYRMARQQADAACPDAEKVMEFCII